MLPQQQNETGIIYKATNIINNKSYIGQTIGTLSQRRYSHELLSINKSKYLFHRAIRKHGMENFKWEVIEECNVSDLNDREIFYIKEFKTYAPENKTGYNMTRGGDNNFGSSGKYHYLNRMPENVKKEWLEKYRNGKNNPNFNNSSSVSGENHFTKKMTDEEYEKWVSNFSGDNNYQKKMTDDERKEKCWINKLSKKEKEIWKKKNILGENNPFYKAVKKNPDLYRGKNNACFGKSFPERLVKYVITYPDGKEEVITKLTEFCKNKTDITQYGLRKVLNKKVDSYNGYKIRYEKE